MAKRKRRPRCIVIAGPNGAGKTTMGLSPLKPDLAAIAAGRMVLREIDRLAESRDDFAFETTISGLTYVRRLLFRKRAGYLIEIVYLRLQSERLALRRIAARVRLAMTCHDLTLRRFKRGWVNFERIYQPLADSWAVYENSDRVPQLLERGP